MKKSAIPVYPAGARKGFEDVFRHYRERVVAYEYMRQKMAKTSTQSPTWDVWYWAQEALNTAVKRDRQTLIDCGVFSAEVSA